MTYDSYMDRAFAVAVVNVAFIGLIGLFMIYFYDGYFEGKYSNAQCAFESALQAIIIIWSAYDINKTRRYMTPDDRKLLAGLFTWMVTTLFGAFIIDLFFNIESDDVSAITAAIYLIVGAFFYIFGAGMISKHIQNPPVSKKNPF